MPSIEPLYREYAASQRGRRKAARRCLGVTLVVLSVLSAVAIVPRGVDTGLLRLARAQDETPPLSALTRTAAELQAKGDAELKAKKLDDAIDTYRKLLAHLDENKSKFTDF